MAKQINVDVHERKPGKKFVKKTRSQKHVPIVIYGKGKDSEFGSIEDLYFRKQVMTHEHALFSLNYKGRSIAAVVRNLDVDYLNNKIVHADFYEVNMNQKMDATVSLRFVGEAEGTLNGEGVLNRVLEEIHVFCLPADIPSDIEIDVSHLNIDDRILISDLKLPSNVEILHEMDQTIVTVAVKAEEPVVEETPVVAAGAEGQPAAAEASEGASEGAAKPAAASAEKADKPAAKPKKEDKAS